MREGLARSAPFEIRAKQSRDVIFHHRRRHPAQQRLADPRVLAQAAAQDNVESFQRLAIGSATGGALKPDIAGPMLRARMRASVEIHFESADFRTKLVH